jgi:hypothetical protein
LNAEALKEPAGGWQGASFLHSKKAAAGRWNARLQRVSGRDAIPCWPVYVETSAFGLGSEVTMSNPARAVVVAQMAGRGHDLTGGAPEGLLGAGFQNAKAPPALGRGYRPHCGPAAPPPREVGRTPARAGP